MKYLRIPALSPHPGDLRSRHGAGSETRPNIAGTFSRATGRGRDPRPTLRGHSVAPRGGVRDPRPTLRRHAVAPWGEGLEKTLWPRNRGLLLGKTANQRFDVGIREVPGCGLQHLAQVDGAFKTARRVADVAERADAVDQLLAVGIQNRVAWDSLAVELQRRLSSSPPESMPSSNLNRT